jgi:hypothetical protein
METQSEGLEPEQALVSIDLTEVANAHPVNQQVAVLNLNTFDATQLTLLEVLDMAEAADVEPDAMGTLLGNKRQSAKRMRLMFAMAWCIARRANPLLTFAEVCTWRLEVIGEVDPVRTEKLQKRADIIVGAASVSGLHPDEAANLTIAELTSYQERRKRGNRAARRAAGRRAG